LIIGGFVTARLAWRAVAAAWDRAMTVARDRGFLA
jgi:branched-chain amino acid transport system permease protein